MTNNHQYKNGTPEELEMILMAISHLCRKNEYNDLVAVVCGSPLNKPQIEYGDPRIELLLNEIISIFYPINYSYDDNKEIVQTIFVGEEDGDISLYFPTSRERIGIKESLKTILGKYHGNLEVVDLCFPLNINL